MNRRLLLVLVAALGLFVGGRWLASVLGLDSEQIHATLEAYGVWAPALYVLILSARHFIALPSSLALTIGGGLFAVETATIAGSIGLFISALVDFWFFRVIKPEGVMERLAARSGGATRAAEQSTPLILVVATAIPPLPQTMCYLGAAMTDLSFARFAALVGPSGIPRAFVLALLGSGIVSGDLAVTAWAAAAVLIPCALAMSSPRIRAALLPARRSDETENPAIPRLDDDNSKTCVTLSPNARTGPLRGTGGGQDRHPGRDPEGLPEARAQASSRRQSK